MDFIKRNTHDTKNIQALIMPYTSLVRSILEFASFILDPYQQTNIDRFHRIQNKFLCFAEYRCGTKPMLNSLSIYS